MSTTVIKKITNPTNEEFATILGWMREWWGKPEGYREEELTIWLKHCFNANRLPLTFGHYIEEGENDAQLIGMYQFQLEDTFVRPDIYPWLANLYIVPEQRGKGYGRMLLESVRDNYPQHIFPTRYLHLYTYHENLYERFGWKRHDDIDLCVGPHPHQTIYQLKLL